VDPVTPGAFSAAAKIVAQQSFQAGKARMRVKPSHDDRKSAYMRLQDAAVATMSVMLMIASSYESGMKLPEPLMLRLEAETSEFGKALRGLYMVAPQDVVDAAERVAGGLALFQPNMGKEGVADAVEKLDPRLNGFLRATRVNLRYDLPYRKHWWQFRRPLAPVRDDP
jgi:hypothetical protein